ncbi:MAG: penicillin-binding protein 1A [Janthinobacterium lividum]
MFRYLSSLAIVLFITLGLGLASLCFVFYYFGAGLPDYQQLSNYKPPVVTRLYAGDGHMFGEYAWERRVYVPIQAIPKKVIQAFLAAEDKNFYEHSGVDIPSIISAVISNVGRVADSKRPVGASTITQQVAKNFLLADIAQNVSYVRKIKEAILAFRIENAYSKNYILELFLNEIYLGSGSYGIAAAALNYFNKGLDDLSLAEIAYLAGLPKAPNHYHPVRNAAAAKGRRNYVLRRLQAEGYITAQDARMAMEEPIVFKERNSRDVIKSSYFAEEVRRELLHRFGEKALYQEGLVVRTSLDSKLQNFAQQSLCEGLETYDQRHGWRGPIGHVVLETAEKNLKNIDASNPKSSWAMKLQSVSVPLGAEPEQVAVVLGFKGQATIIGFRNGKVGQIPLKELQWARRYINEYSLGPVVQSPQNVLQIGDVILTMFLETKDEYKLSQIPVVSGAIVVMDVHTGRILAMQGGYSFKISQFNRATQAMRQVGSTFKPFAYLTALEKGLTPSSMMYDGPFSIDVPGIGVWSPHNFEKNYLGAITLRRALELSRNLVTVRMVHDYVGMRNVKNLVERLGVVDNLPMQLATLLGAAESTLLKVTSAFGMIANGGKRIQPTLLDRVQDRYGKNLYINHERTCEGCASRHLTETIPTLIDHRDQVIDPANAYQMVSMLQGVIERGTGKSLLDLNRPLAGKTGTSNSYRDAWFVGFTPDIVVGIFVGFDTPRDMGQYETGARVALPIFKNFITKALKDTPAMPFRIPSGIKLVRVDALTGKPPVDGSTNVIFEAFKSGSEQKVLDAPSTPAQNENMPQDPSHDDEFSDILEDKPSTIDPSQPYAEPARPNLPTSKPKPFLDGTGGLY